MLAMLRYRFGLRLRVGPAEADGRVACEVRGHAPEPIAAELAGFGSSVEVLEPVAVRMVLSRIAAELTEVYGGEWARPGE
jgi:hypothetical protein